MQPMKDPNMVAPAHFHHPQMQQVHDQEAVLLDQIKSQIEFYFSDHNLQKDTFMQSILTSKEHFGAAPVHVIANFPRVRELYASGRAGHYVHANMAPAADASFVCRAMMNSTLVRVSNDGHWLIPVNSAFVWSQQQKQKTTPPPKGRVGASADSPASIATSESSKGVPVHPLPGSTTVVVQDIPNNCSQEVLMKVFTANSIKPKSAHKDANGTWYLIFDSKDQAMQAISSSQGQTIGGQPVQADLLNDEESLTPSTRDEPPPRLLQAPPPMHPATMHSPPPAQGMPPMQHFAHSHPGMMVQYPMVPYGVLQQGMAVAVPFPMGQPQIGYAVMAPEYTLPQDPPPQHVYVPPPRSEDGDRFDGSSAHSGSTNRRRSRASYRRRRVAMEPMRRKSGSSISTVGSEPPKQPPKIPSEETPTEAAKVPAKEPPMDPPKEASQSNKQSTKPYKSHKAKRRQNAKQNNNSYNETKPNQTHNNKKTNKKKGKRNMLSDENFPALGGSNKATHPQEKTAPERTAYAEALLKAPKASSKPKGEVQHVENQLKQMTVTDDKVEQAPSQSSGEAKA